MRDTDTTEKEITHRQREGEKERTMGTIKVVAVAGMRGAGSQLAKTAIAAHTEANRQTTTKSPRGRTTTTTRRRRTVVQELSGALERERAKAFPDFILWLYKPRGMPITALVLPS